MAAREALSRRGFLRLTGGAALAVAMGASCGGGSSKSKPASAAPSSGAAKPKLRIMQVTHYVPPYDVFFDDYARRWGEEHGVDVVVEHVPAGDLVARADAEAEIKPIFEKWRERGKV